MHQQFTAIFVKGEAGFIVAYIEELPGAYGQGTTVEEARNNLQSALEVQLACTRRDHWKVFKDARILRREKMLVTSMEAKANRRRTRRPEEPAWKGRAEGRSGT